jgi:hypothetical protein
MDEKTDEILEHIETQRNQLGANLNELETRVRETADWRTHFDRNPMLMLGAALGGGILLGAIVGNAARSRSSDSYSAPRQLSSSSVDIPARSTATSYQRSRTSETLDHIRAALIAFGTAKAKEFMNQALPGFDSFLRDAESRGPRTGSQHRGGDYPSTSSGQTQGNYSQQTSGQGANYGQNFGSEFGRPSAGQSSYNREREYAGSGHPSYGNS